MLTMTATPIPRTLALTVYGDLDLSVLDQMPLGQNIIKTWVVPPHKRTPAYSWLETQIKNTKSQAFIICPFIDPSETLTSVKAASQEFVTLEKTVFPRLKLSLLHGRMKSVEKTQILDKFRRHQIDVLVATPIVEVGLDIPDATIMVVEAAERYGLAQLHQLRGRVGDAAKRLTVCCLRTPKTPGLSTGSGI